MKRNPFSQMTVSQLQKEAQKRMSELKQIREVLAEANAVFREINSSTGAITASPSPRRSSPPPEPFVEPTPNLQFSLVAPLEPTDVPESGEVDEVFAQIVEELSPV